MLNAHTVYMYVYVCGDVPQCHSNNKTNNRNNTTIICMPPVQLAVFGFVIFRCNNACGLRFVDFDRHVAPAMHAVIDVDVIDDFDDFAIAAAS